MKLTQQFAARERELLAKKEEEKRQKELKKQEQVEKRRREAEVSSETQGFFLFWISNTHLKYLTNLAVYTLCWTCQWSHSIFKTAKRSWDVPLP